MRASQIEYQVNPISAATIVNAESPVRACTCHSEEITAVLMLYDNGVICECNNAAGELLGCAPSKLTWQNISTFLPQLSQTSLMQGERINPNLRFLSHIGYGFEMIGISGVHFACALFFNEVENFGRHCLRIIIRPIAQEYLVA